MNCTTCKQLCKVNSLNEEQIGYVCLLFRYENVVYEIKDPDKEMCEEYDMRFESEE